MIAQKSNLDFCSGAGKLERYSTVESAIQKKSFEAWSIALSKDRIEAGSYKLLEFKSAGAFIFCDPPYRRTIRYEGSDHEWGDREQLALLDWALERSKNGATVWIANIDSGDNFFQNYLGDRASYHYFEVHHTIGSAKKLERFLLS